jgi:hypothetical protein
LPPKKVCGFSNISYLRQDPPPKPDENIAVAGVYLKLHEIKNLPIKTPGFKTIDGMTEEAHHQYQASLKD